MKQYDLRMAARAASYRAFVQKQRAAFVAGSSGEYRGGRSMMQRVSDEALAKLARDVCPDCDTLGPLEAGPRGGINQNIACRRCGAEFNVARYGGRMIQADRLTPFGEPDIERLWRVYAIRL